METGNEFLVDLVIQIMLEESDVDTLKTLREMNSNWNQLDLKELGKRALQHQMKPLDFAKKGFPEELYQFFETTSEVPRLFKSFQLDFPESLKYIDFSFFTKYTPNFLHLEINNEFKFTDRTTQYLLNFFSWISPSLEQLKLVRVHNPNSMYEYSRKKQVIPCSVQAGHPLIFHKLTKLIWDHMERKNDAYFNFILDRSGEFDPTPNLTTLEVRIHKDFINFIDPWSVTALSRWSKLTSLTISAFGELDSFGATLSFLGEAGMALKSLILDLDQSIEEDCPDLSGDWSNFLSTQAKSLQFLDFDCSIFRSWTNNPEEEFLDDQIKLPIFEELHTLHLDLNYRVAPIGEQIQTSMFQMGPFSTHFPKLDHLRVNKQGYPHIFPMNVQRGRPIHLKSLFTLHEPEDFDEWKSRFSSVESLTCRSSLLSLEETVVPWGDSLKVLEIDIVRAPLKLSHLTRLEKLIIIEWEGLEGLPDRYLDFFQQVLALGLSSITFKFEKEAPEEVKAKLIDHFPFKVQFEQI